MSGAEISLQKDIVTWPLISHWGGDKAAEKKITNFHLCFPRRKGEERFLPKSMLFLQESQSAHTCCWGSAEEAANAPSSPPPEGSFPSLGVISSNTDIQRKTQQRISSPRLGEQSCCKWTLQSLTAKNKGSLTPQSHTFGFLQLFCINFH